MPDLAREISRIAAQCGAWWYLPAEGVLPPTGGRTAATTSRQLRVSLVTRAPTAPRLLALQQLPGSHRRCTCTVVAYTAV